MVCNAYHKNPNYAHGNGPYLIRCRRQASVAITIRIGPEVDILIRCQRCRDELTAQAESGTAILEVLNEVEAK